jgi:L-serine deaminase
MTKKRTKPQSLRHGEPLTVRKVVVVAVVTYAAMHVLALVGLALGMAVGDLIAPLRDFTPSSAIKIPEIPL